MLRKLSLPVISEVDHNIIILKSLSEIRRNSFHLMFETLKFEDYKLLGRYIYYPVSEINDYYISRALKKRTRVRPDKKVDHINFV